MTKHKKTLLEWPHAFLHWAIKFSVDWFTEMICLNDIWNMNDICRLDSRILLWIVLKAATIFERK